MDQLNDVEEVVFAQLAEPIRHFLVVPPGLPLLKVTSLARLRSARIVVAANGAGLAEDVDEVLGGILESDGLDVVVLWSGEVQVMVDGNLTTLLGGKHVNGHLELAPALILASKGSFMKG